MNRVVFRWTLRQNARLIAIVSASCAAFFFLVLLAMSAFAADTAHVTGMFRDPPRAVAAFVGGNADFLHPSGWLATTLLHPIVLALEASVAFALGAGAVATELEHERMDLVLTRPMRRTSFLGAKATAASVAVGIVQAAGVAGVLIARATVRGVNALGVGAVFEAFLGAWILFGAFAMIAVAISAASSARGRALGIATAVVVGSFFVNFIALLFDGVAPMRYLSLFHYYRPADILTGKGSTLDLFAVALVGLAALGVAMRVFARRDLTR